MTLLDWLIVAAYMAGTLVVGWYYAGRNKTADDYLLGGRNMNPRAVGLSLFAALSSTLSFLGVPGETIAYGPMLLCRFVVYPLVFWVAGWVLIPAIMQLRVTTAYEILELRLGLSVRLVGALFFLTLRISWMAVMVHATTTEVLLPLVGLDTHWSPWICALLGLVTLIYTTEGGLRAVVATEVVQSFVLFGGALLTMAVVWTQLGSASSWWPTEWPAHWPTPNWSRPFEGRMTFWGAAIGSFAWWICTLGSDQMAVQRYLATPSVKAARSVLATSLLVDMVVGLFLAALGLALLAYFAANPHLIPAGKTVATSADRLFPLFITSILPAGIVGLVIAGLMATAMDSLSAGMNSASSVVCVDFLDRFGHGRMKGPAAVRWAKGASLVIGALVVGVSSSMSYVEGNIIEVSYRVISLFIAPLFLLFFMALFVPWATSFGALTGAACGSAVAIGIAYGRWFELSFMWIMPAAFVVGLAVAVLASLLPTNRRNLPQTPDL